ncbi:C2 DOCK-type domain-containing protein [Entamoeba marina]
MTTNQEKFKSDVKMIFERDFEKVKEVAPPPVRSNVKKNETNQKILSKNMTLNALVNLMFIKLKKYINFEWKVCLTEETIKYHCSQTFLEKAYKVQESEFIAFHKYIAANIQEITKEQTVPVFDAFERQFADKSGVEFQSKFLDRNMFLIHNDEKPHRMITKPKPSEPTSSKYHHNIYRQLFAPTNSIYKIAGEYVNVLENKSKQKPVNQIREEKALTFTVDSLVHPDSRKQGLRRKKNKHLFEFFNSQLKSNDFQYSTHLCNVQPSPLQVDYKKPSIISVNSLVLNIIEENLYCRLSFYNESFNKLTSDFFFDVSKSQLKSHMDSYAEYTVSKFTSTLQPLDVPICSVQMNKQFINGEAFYAVLFIYKQMEPDIAAIRDIYANDCKKDSKYKKFAERHKGMSKTYEQKKMSQLVMFGVEKIKFKGSYEELKLYRPAGDPKDIVSMVKDLDKLKECGHWGFQFKASKADVIHHDGINTLFNNDIQENSTHFSIGKERKKNGICVSVYLRDTDDKFIPSSSQSLESIYPPETLPQQQLVKHFTTSVSVDKVGHFIDEIKIQLPFPLTDKHHLLFHIRDINTDDGSEGRSFYAMLPLTDNGRIIDNENRTIQIMKDMNDHYTKIVDNYDIAKMYLKLKTQHVSTVYPQHSIISRFIGGEEPNMPITDIMKEMYKTDIIHFFPLVLERCISIVKNGERESIFKVFELLELIDSTEREKVLKQEENESNYRIYKSPLFLNSINHFLPNTTNDGNYLCLILQSTFPKIFDCSKETAEERLKYSWVIFTVFTKSLIGYYNEHNAFNCPNFHDFCNSQTGSIVGVKLYDSLRTISNFIIYCADNGINASLVREANMYYAEFIRDMTVLWKRDIITKLFDDHLDALALVKNLNKKTYTINEN